MGINKISKQPSETEEVLRVLALQRKEIAKARRDLSRSRAKLEKLNEAISSSSDRIADFRTELKLIEKIHRGGGRH